MIEATGADRATWLNNLVTNVIKTLQPGDGNYAFATNVKGRVIFDMNMLMLEDRIWLDVDVRWTQAALHHLNRYIITEDVKLSDLSASYRRLAAMGACAGQLAKRLGVSNAMAMGQLQHIRLDESCSARLVRHDFCGLPAIELVFVSEDATGRLEAVRKQALKSGFHEVLQEVAEILRIEAGIPKSVDDIDEDVVPPETGQIERGINYHKGCYLGQEVIERMRSHGILARKMVGVRIEGDSEPARGAALLAGGQEVGRMTSCCWSEAARGLLALSYVKMAHTGPGTMLSVSTTEGERAAEVVALPVRHEATRA